MRLMRSFVLLLGFFVCAGTGVSLSAETPRRSYVIGEEHSLRSEILGEERTFWVALPESYGSSHSYRDYPVLYVLDGNLFFPSFAGAVRQLSADATPLIPEMIVIGINSSQRARDSTPTASRTGPNGRESEDWAASGGAEAFQRFVERELIPHVERNFAASDYRVLAGYSLTGLTVVHNLLTRPEVFDAHIVMDGALWWDDAMILELAREAAGRPRFDGDQLFIVTTTQRYPTPYITVEPGGRELAALLSARPVPGLRVVHHERTRETHHSLPLISLYEGLAAIFDGHAMTLDELYLAPREIEARFERLSERLGHVFHPPEGTMDFFGYNFMRYLPEREMDKALVFFELNTRSYPRSPGAWTSLAEARLEMGDAAAARQALARALALRPGYERAQRALHAMETGQGSR
ncbi:alpha/beta hydrolase [Sphingosinicella terrae]|uniref:alpha/beta hydrolase n=1 Tax=Sphingosinicella terrae TaxID=2172047 RepID=UPI000E0D5B80|nr:alpha/beta hydrolase-fold protein [Sphingosinicella terrae]